MKLILLFRKPFRFEKSFEFGGVIYKFIEMFVEI